MMASTRMTAVELTERIRELSRRVPGLVELELCDVRDGDGFWHGSDALGGTLDELVKLLDEWRRDVRVEIRATCTGCERAYSYVGTEAEAEGSMQASLEEWERRGFQTEVSVFGEEQGQ